VNASWGGTVIPPTPRQALSRAEDRLFEATAAGGFREPATSLPLLVARKKITKRWSAVGFAHAVEKR
jgi:hypothetical protein